MRLGKPFKLAVALLLMVGGTLWVAMAASWATTETDRRNIALGRSYRVEPAPNYAGALGKRQTELTDGQVASGSFWTNGQSVGWSWHSPVIVTIDLASVSAVDHVRIHTGANTSVGIRYPAQLLVFGGDSARRFELLAASEPHRDRDDPSDAETRFIDIRFAARKVAQIVVVAFSRGSLMFLSEIEAYAAPIGAELGATLLSVSQVREAAIRYRREAIERLEPKPIGPTKAQRWAMPLSPDDQSNSGCEVLPIDPWNLRPTSTVGALVTLADGYAFAAWRIANRTARDAEVGVSVQAPAAVDVRMHALAYAQALNYAWVPDVVVPFEIKSIPPQAAVIAVADVHPRVAQEHGATITITCNGKPFAAPLQVMALAENTNVPALHGNLWSYLHERSHAPVANALRCDPDFHARYGVDTLVVHPDALLDAGRGRPTNLLRRYLHAYRTAKRVLLYMDINSRPWAFLHLEGDRAVEALRSWWQWVESIAQDEGITSELVLYPVDEPSSDDVARLARFRDLVAQAGLKAGIYATIDSKEIAAKLAWLDDMQILDPARNGLPGTRRDRLELYATEPDGRLLPLEGYYRAQGWTAYRLGLAGVGVWSSWDGTGIAVPATGWMPFGADDRDFALIYSAADGCALPSRRLLAWRRGIEENRILRQCALSMPQGEVDRIVAATATEGGETMSRALAEVAASCRSTSTRQR